VGNIPHPAFDGADRGFRNVGKKQSDATEIPKRTHTIFETRRKFEINNRYVLDLVNGVKCFGNKTFGYYKEVGEFLGAEGEHLPSYPLAYEDGTDTVFRNVGY
jgi:hypothetical protein